MSLCELCADRPEQLYQRNADGTLSPTCTRCDDMLNESIAKMIARRKANE